MEAKDLKIVTTDGGEIGKVGRERWIRNLLEFTAPLLIMYITFISGRVQVNGFQVDDFVPSQIEIGAMILWVLNAAQDFLKKYIRPQAYVVEKK